MAFRIQPNAKSDAFDGMITGASTNATLIKLRSLPKLRSPSEGAFTKLKWWRGAGRAIYLGLVKMSEQVTLAVTVRGALKSLRLRERCSQ